MEMRGCILNGDVCLQSCYYWSGGWKIIVTIIIIIVIIIIIIIIIIIEQTHGKTILENTVEIELEPVTLDIKNLSQYSSRSK